MKNPSISSGHVSSATGIRPSIRSLTVILAVSGLLVVLPLATSLSKTILSTPDAPAIAATIPVQSQTSTFYLHGTGPVNNPPTLFLNTTAPTATTEKYKDSAGISRNNGNLWKEVGTWSAAAGMTTGTLTSFSDLHVWLGLKNSDDQGTYFDLRVEAYQNNTLLTSGQSLCIQGITRNPNLAKEVVLVFATFSATTFNGTSDVLKLKISTRVGTTAAGGSCGGHNNAVGLRLYFDALSRTSRFTAAQGLATDTTPPVLVVEQPASGLVTPANQIGVSGTFSDQSPTTITVNGIAAAIQGNSFTASVSLAEGLNTIQVVATDAASNQSTASLNVTRDSIAPVLNVITPAQGLVTTDEGITLFGEVTDETQTVLTVDGTPVIVNGNVFSTQLSPPEGTNQVHVRATDAAGNFTEVVRTVTSDFTEPVITDLTPLDGTLINGVTTTIQGRAIDATAVTVTVGTTTANVAPGGLFTAPNVPIAEGENKFLITALDAAGNQSEAELSLEGKDLTNPAAPVVFPVRSPTKLSFQSIEGRAEPGTKVRIAGGVAIAETSAAAGTGLFVVNVDLSVGANALQVTSTDATNNLSPAVGVSITSDPDLELAPDGQASRITVATGDTQRGLVNVELPRPLIAIVRDRSGNTVSNTTVRFSVTHGGGQFTNGSAVTDVQTDAHGYASARYVSGAAQGIQLIRADFAGNVFSPTTFMAEALIAAPGGTTSVSGTVRDVNLRALPNVLVRISGQQSRTGADGRFRIENVPAGPHQILELIGRDQITLPGRWPNISYDIDVLPGVDNNPGRQLFLPKVNEGIPIPLDANNVVTQDTSTQLYVAGGEPPIVITARAGTQVTFPPDVTDKRLSVTRIPVSRVPMPLENGLATNLFISVQPAGAIFDQPLEVSFPNFDQLPPGTEVLLMSFDHDAGRYVQVGSGTVSADGQRVTSDPGSGIRVGAWHAFPPSPPSPGGGAPPTEEITVLGQIKITGNSDLEGIHIDEVLAQLGGRRAMVLTAQAQWHHSPELLVRGTETRRRGSGGNAAPVHIDVDVQTTLPEVTLEEVEFKENYTLRPDDGGQEYKDPHWQKPATPDPNYKGKPVGYKNEGQKKIKLAAKFSLAQEITDPPKPKVMVKANGNDPFELDAVVAKYDKGSKTVKLEGAPVLTAFPTDTIDYFPAMNFEWEVSLNGGVKWNPAGTSSNPMYVTLGKPRQAFLTTVHLATANLSGKTKSQMQIIVDTIWADFSDRAVYRAADTNQQTKLKYWGAICNVGGTDPDLCFEPKGLMVQADARCEGWSEFLFDILRTQAVSAAKIWIEGKPKTILGTQGVYVSGIVVKNNPSQGGHLTAPVRFNGHAIVRIKVNNVEKLYDPSYGTGPFVNLIAWEDASLVEVTYRETKTGPIIPSQTVPNKPNSEETVLSVQPN